MRKQKQKPNIIFVLIGIGLTIYSLKCFLEAGVIFMDAGRQMEKAVRR